MTVGGCGSTKPLDPAMAKKFLSSVYTQAPDIGSYRTSTQLLSLGQAVCDDLRAGASVQQLGDRLPLTEGSVALPPADLGLVISAAVQDICPEYQAKVG
jgi:hypothetical protein